MRNCCGGGGLSLDYKIAERLIDTIRQEAIKQTKRKERKKEKEKIAFIEEQLARIEERLAIQDADVPQLFDDDAEKTYFPKFRSVKDNNLLELENSDCNTSLHNLPPKKE